IPGNPGNADGRDQFVRSDQHPGRCVNERRACAADAVKSTKRGVELSQADLAAGGGGGVYGVQDLLDAQGFLHRNGRLLALQDAIDEMMDAILRIRDLQAGELDGFVAIGTVAEKPCGIKRETALRAEQVHAMLPAFARLIAGPTDFEIDGAAALE